MKRTWDSLLKEGAEEAKKQYESDFNPDIDYFALLEEFEENPDTENSPEVLSELKGADSNNNNNSALNYISPAVVPENTSAQITTTSNLTEITTTTPAPSLTTQSLIHENSAEPKNNFQFFPRPNPSLAIYGKVEASLVFPELNRYLALLPASTPIPSPSHQISAELQLETVLAAIKNNIETKNLYAMIVNLSIFMAMKNELGVKKAYLTYFLVCCIENIFLDGILHILGNMRIFNQLFQFPSMLLIFVLHLIYLDKIQNIDLTKIVTIIAEISLIFPGSANHKLSHTRANVGLPFYEATPLSMALRESLPIVIVEALASRDTVNTPFKFFCGLWSIDIYPLEIAVVRNDLQQFATLMKCGADFNRIVHPLFKERLAQFWECHWNKLDGLFVRQIDKFLSTSVPGFGFK